MKKVLILFLIIGIPIILLVIIDNYFDDKSEIYIEKEAFYSCDSLTTINIPYSVISIGGGVFSGCKKLLNVNISDKNENFAVINNILYNKKEKSVISCFSNNSYITIPSGTRKIESNAFSWCKQLEKLEIPNTVTFIGEQAFSNCSVLKYVNIPDSVTEINKSTFLGCRELVSVDFPYSVTNIGYGAFAMCKSLKNIEIPDSVIQIESLAFTLCSSLTSITIPDSVMSIGKEAFDDCPSLTIQCNAGSYTEQYCKENNLKYFTTPDWLLD